MGIENQIDIFMQQEMPQIQMHGGDWEILDTTDGNVEIQLEDACDGCGISPMTIQAIKNRMPKKIDGVQTVEAHTGGSDENEPTTGPF